MKGLKTLPTSMKLGIGAILLSAVYASASVRGALDPAPVEASPSAARATIATVDESPPGRVATINSAVERDPFNPDRTRPASRYRLAGEVDEEPTTPQRRMPIRWVGITLNLNDTTKHSLTAALGTNQNAPTLLLKVGEQLGDYSLMSVDIKGATFQTPNGELIYIPNPNYHGSR